MDSLLNALLYTKKALKAACRSLNIWFKNEHDKFSDDFPNLTTQKRGCLIDQPYEMCRRMLIQTNQWLDM